MEDGCNFLWVQTSCNLSIMTSCGGIVVASTQEEAKQKVKEMYEDWDGDEESEKEDIIKVWKAILDDDYSNDYPDILKFISGNRFRISRGKSKERNIYMYGMLFCN